MAARPKPLELKKLEGTDRKDRTPVRPLKPPPIAPSIPRGISPGGRKLWKEIGPHLSSLGLLTSVDGPEFTMLCESFAIAVECLKTVKAEGLMIPGQNGEMRKHPLLQIYKDNVSLFNRLAIEFGLTPSARAKMSMPEPEDSEDFFDF